MGWRPSGSIWGLVLLPLLVDVGGPVLAVDAFGAYSGPAPWSESYMLDPALDPCSRPSWPDDSGGKSGTALDAVELFYAMVDPGVAGHVVSVEVLPGGWLTVTVSGGAPRDILSGIVAHAARTAAMAGLWGVQVIVVDSVEVKAMVGGTPGLVEPVGRTRETPGGSVARATDSGAPARVTGRPVDWLEGTCRQALVTVEGTLSAGGPAPLLGMLERGGSGRVAAGEASQPRVSLAIALAAVGGIAFLVYCLVRRCGVAVRRVSP